MDRPAKSNFFYRVFCGAFLGISVIAPGISGSIMAVMMGIYDDLIEIISNPLKNFKKNCMYVIPMGIGAVISMCLFLQLLKLLFEYYPTPAYLLFISLIAGSYPVVWKEIQKGGWKKRYAIGFVCAFAFALVIGYMAKHNVPMTDSALLTDGLAKRIYYPVCGAVAGVSGMIPGMSVSMVLMMLHVYEPLLDAAAGFDLVTIVPVAVCFVIGMVLFSRLTKYIFHRYHGFGYAMVLGFMTGSILNIFPGLPVGPLNWILSIVAIGIGVMIALLFQMLGRKFHA